MHQAGIAALFIDNVPHSSILTSSTRVSGRAPLGCIAPHIDAFLERDQMSESNAQSLEGRIAAVVQRLLAEHGIEHVVGLNEDLRTAGLSSLDMVSLVLSVEEELNLMVPETGITPANFRSIASISRLVASLRQGI